MKRREPLRDLPLLARVAHLYYEAGLSQTELAERLHVSQASVSRLLRRALDSGMVRISVTPPTGCFPELEESLRSRYNLSDVVVAPGSSENQSLEDLLGQAAAPFVESQLQEGDVVGLSSWSRSLLGLVRAMHPVREKANIHVVQILGGLGNPAAEVHANQLTARFSALVGGEAHFLPVPGIVATAQLKKAYLEDPFTRSTMALFDRLTFALVGIGAVEPSDLVAKSGNILQKEELEKLRQKGAVGDICMRFFDQEGNALTGAWFERVCAITLEQFRSVPRRLAVAGGEAKRNALAGALRGGWITHLVTDEKTADWLVRQ